MTDKQIINRVNVKECEYYCNGKCERYEEFVEADYANYSVKCICEKENDLGTYDICDYQQLKRKEQECEELKEELIEIRWKIEAQDIELNDNVEQLDQLKAENEELKKCYKNNSALLDFEETNTTKLINKVMKLEKTFAEIKEIAEEQQSWNEWNSKHSETESEDDIFAYNWSALKQILQKISEVENE